MSVSVSETFASAGLFVKKSGIRQSQKLDLVNIYLHAKTYQNIPCYLKVICPKSVSKNILPQQGYLQRNQALDNVIG